MSRLRVLIEVTAPARNAFATRSALLADSHAATRAVEDLVADLDGFGLDVNADIAPVPLFSKNVVQSERRGFAAFATTEESGDAEAASLVVAAEVTASKLDELQSQSGITVWPDAEISFFDGSRARCSRCAVPTSRSLLSEEWADAHPLDVARSSGGVDCRPFRDGVPIDDIRELLAVDAVWRTGFRGQNVVVGVLDEGINGEVYPVIGGFGGTSPLAPRPGSASIQSHGSMVAADILVAAPAAKLLDYPILNRFAADTLDVLQEVLESRRVNGTPHLLNNSWGFVFRPREQSPNHPNWDPNHPVNRKFEEVIASGASVLFAAGNCGPDCPSGNCDPREVSLGGVTGPASIDDVICVAAVNSRHERVGYSTQGPGEFSEQKPDVAGYTHLFGNFGTGRPGGSPPPFDNGTSAATPVVSGVVALLMSALGAHQLSPQRVKQVLMESAIDIGVPGWDTSTGFGVVNAGAAYKIASRADECCECGGGSSKGKPSSSRRRQ